MSTKGSTESSADDIKDDDLDILDSPPWLLAANLTPETVSGESQSALF